ncbi:MULTISPECIES: CbtA family protein [Bradyrhizobium]|uniref:CbtA family protein n=3 Tax=Bradyrhizobium TaxID=374 RepID=A0A973WYH5_9BRAD|nr:MULTISPECIES: CbtA family protein [Bradyrhizobium]UFX49389.1 CbtA family protein [Bradyrhizobium sp. 41S5]UGA49115.1 CbtA family protein [Bradyrhizobium quebecense]UGY07470.1 CbtA family protein [Bradyrhizobium quebecense]
MMGKLLARGMIVGLVAALLSFGFLKVFGEPSIERAIAFEKVMEAAAAKQAAHEGALPPAGESEPELVSRGVQSGIGLLVGLCVYSAACGGLFALAFALAYRRMGDFSPRATSALLAAAGFISVYVTPMLKYPASPPSVGLPETIDMRTSLYFAMVLISLAAMIAAGVLRRRVNSRFGEWNSALIAGGGYVVVMIFISLAMPALDEVPDGFPATLLWQFRIASFGGQIVMWATLGLLFGVAAERALVERRLPLRDAMV